jgi:predicted kinase
MRKWMSERLKRRKKSDDTTGKEAAPAQEPLQPRFYDNEEAATKDAPSKAASAKDSFAGESSTAAPETRQPSAEPEVVSAPEMASQGQGQGQGQGRQEAAARPRTSRRRRSRGGRGGSRGRTAGSPPAPVVAAALAATDLAATEAAGAEARGAEAAAAPNLSRDSSQSVAASQGAAAPRASKGTVVLAIGLPGSGKSSWFKRHNIHPLSSDLLRELLFDDAQEQRFQDLVFSNLRSMLKARLIARRPMNYVDATNLTPHDRHSWIKLAKDYGYDVQGLYFDVPLEVCMERHKRRGRVVPDEIMRKMAGKLKPPTFEEGFSKITVVRLKQKEAAAG